MKVFFCFWIFYKDEFLKNRSFLKKTHYPYLMIESDPVDKNKTGVFHIMSLC